MRLSIFITLTLVSFHQAFATASNGLTFENRQPNGDTIFYKKGSGSESGLAASYSVLRHPQNQNLKVIVTKSTDGQEILIKNIYDSQNQMIDCDVEMNQQEVENFQNEIDSELDVYQKNAGSANAKIEKPENGRALDDLKLDVQAQLERCEDFLQNQARADSDRKMPVEIAENEGDDDQGSAKRRQKRAYLIWPGTNWCGKGSKAEFAQSYGENVEADQCCQKHDQCPYIIEGFTTRYNLFNYRMHTLSVCDCDQTFMDCLKSANTSTATMVGKVFFNVVNTECFELKLQKTCAKRSWWGGCEKYTTKWTATIKTLGNFQE